jgi:hypothetical protein
LKQQASQLMYTLESRYGTITVFGKDVTSNTDALMSQVYKDTIITSDICYLFPLDPININLGQLTTIQSILLIGLLTTLDLNKTKVKLSASNVFEFYKLIRSVGGRARYYNDKIAQYVLSLSGNSEKLKRFDTMDVIRGVNVNKLVSSLRQSVLVGFLADDVDISQTITNRYSDSELDLDERFVQLLRQYGISVYLGSSLAKSIIDLIGINKSTTTNEPTSNIPTNLPETLMETATLAILLSKLIKNIQLPRVYTSTSYNCQCSITITLVANSTRQFYENIFVPSLYLTGMTLQQAGPDYLNRFETTNRLIKDILAILQNYSQLFAGEPHYVTLLVPGKIFIPLGIITDFNLQTSKETFANGWPKKVTINLTVSDIANIVVATKDLKYLAQPTLPLFTGAYFFDPIKYVLEQDISKLDNEFQSREIMLAMGHPILKTLTKDRLSIETGTGTTGPIAPPKKDTYTKQKDTYTKPNAKTRKPIKTTGCNNYVIINGEQVPVKVKYERGRITTYILRNNRWVFTEDDNVRKQLQQQLRRSGRLCLDEVSLYCNVNTVATQYSASSLISQIPSILYDNKFRFASSVPLDVRAGLGHHAGTDIPTGSAKIDMGTDITNRISRYFGICSSGSSDANYILRAKTSDGKIVIVDMKHYEIEWNKIHIQIVYRTSLSYNGF